MKRATKYLIVGISISLGSALYCGLDSGLEPTRSGFRGTVRFKNNWPEQTDQLMVVAATKFPPTAITEIVMGDPLPLFVDSAEYAVYTPPAKFAAVGVVWKEKNQPWDVTNIIGFYFPTEDHWTPGSVEIKNRDSMVDSVDIVADLSKAKRKVASTLEGTLKVQGTWPSAAQSVLIAALTALPSPKSSLLDVSFGIPIIAGFDSTVYIMSIQPGTYLLITALVIEENAPIGLQSIRGIYKKKPTDFFSPVTVPTDTSHIKDINITIDFSASPFPAYVDRSFK